MVLIANGIDISGILVLGFVVVLPLLLFNAAVEAPVLAKFLGVRWKDLYRPLLKANM